MECSGKLDKGVFQYSLYAGGAVGEPTALRSVQVNRLIGISRWAEEFVETRRIAALGSGVKFEVVQIQRESTIGGAAHQLPYSFTDRRPSVGGEPHNFVFVLVHFEAEICGECRVQHP